MMNLYQVRRALEQGQKMSDLPLRVTFYARVSTSHEEQLNSLENQVLFFKNYIKKQNNWTYIEGYIDEGISGTRVNKRLFFQKMLVDAKEGKFDYILTKEISRFSRNTLDSIKYTQELLSYGVGIYFFNDNINTLNPDAELRLTIMSSIAQDEVRKLSERIRFGYKRSVERGLVAGNNNIYGYQKNKGKLEIVEQEAEIIKWIFKTYSEEKMGTTKLGHYLYQKYHIHNKRGKPFSGTAIARILRNPKYKGYYCAHKVTTVDYHTQKRMYFKPEDWVVYKDYEHCPPLVSDALWNKCNTILKKNHQQYLNKTRTDMRYALSGKIKCLHDGASFIKGSYKNKKTGEIHQYWACSYYRKNGKKACSMPIIHYEEMVALLRKMAFFLFNLLIEDIYHLVSNYHISSYSNIETKGIHKKILDIQNAILALIDMLARKEITKEEYKIQRKRYEDSMDLLKMQIKQYNKISQVDSFAVFKQKGEQMLRKDDECVLSIMASLMKKIDVERINNKLVLYLHLNTLSRINHQIDLKTFLLLFSTNE